MALMALIGEQTDPWPNILPDEGITRASRSTSGINKSRPWLAETSVTANMAENGAGETPTMLYPDLETTN